MARLLAVSVNLRHRPCLSDEAHFPGNQWPGLPSEGSLAEPALEEKALIQDHTKYLAFRCLSFSTPGRVREIDVDLALYLTQGLTVLNYQDHDSIIIQGRYETNIA